MIQCVISILWFCYSLICAIVLWSWDSFMVVYYYFGQSPILELASS